MIADTPINWSDLVIYAWPDDSPASLTELLTGWELEIEAERQLSSWEELRTRVLSAPGYDTYGYWSAGGWQALCWRYFGGLGEIDKLNFGVIEWHVGSTDNWFQLNIRFPPDIFLYTMVGKGRMIGIDLPFETEISDSRYDSSSFPETSTPLGRLLLRFSPMPKTITLSPRIASAALGLSQQLTISASLSRTLLDLGVPPVLWPSPTGSPVLLEVSSP